MLARDIHAPIQLNNKPYTPPLLLNNKYTLNYHTSMSIRFSGATIGATWNIIIDLYLIFQLHIATIK